jgi:hypothetical protein
MHLAGLTVGSPVVLASAAEGSANGGAAVEGQWHLDARAALAASR